MISNLDLRANLLKSTSQNERELDENTENELKMPIFIIVAERLEKLNANFSQ